MISFRNRLRVAPWRTVVCLLLTGFCLQVSAGRDEAEKWALLVGIDSYRNLSNLRGTKNDVADMKDLLVMKFGFPASQVTTLLDEQATRAAILARFESDLIQKVSENDTAVFYFSGHGAQMRDGSGDEPDGFDETLVPHDSRQKGIFDISDDEIHDLLTRLLARCHNVTFIFDSCHSSSGQKTAMRKAPFDERPIPGLVSRGLNDGGSSGLGRLQNENYVMIAACGTTEVATEVPVRGKLRGALTYNLAKVLRRIETGTSWQDIFNMVVNGVHRKTKDQTPQLHGNGQRSIFGSEDLATEPFILVSEGGSKEVTLAGGAIHGLAPGSVFNVYPPATTRDQKPISRIKLTQVDDFSSVGRIEKGGPVPAGARASAEWHPYQTERPTLYFKDQTASKILQKARRAIHAEKLVACVDREGDARMVLSRDAEKRAFVLKNPAGDLQEVSVPEDDLAGLMAAITTWVKWFNVLAIESSGQTTPSIDFTIETFAGSEGQKREPSVGPAVFFVGEQVVMKASNRSHGDLFFTVLALSPNGEIAELYPDGEGQQPFTAGITKEVATFDVSLPPLVTAEKTIVKVFATLVSIDLGFLSQPGVMRRGVTGGAHPIESMLSPGSRSGGGNPARWTVMHVEAEVRHKP